MKRTVYTFLFALAFILSEAQVTSEKQIHDKAIENIAEVMFDSRDRETRDRISQFENAFGIKLYYRVEDQSLDKLGGLSEHLFKIFQTLTLPSNVKANLITGEFSALKDNILDSRLSYRTFATNELRTCPLPDTDTKKIDELYTKVLQEQQLNASDVNEAPEHLNGVFSQGAHDYGKILVSHADCPGVFNKDAYQQHVINTRDIRKASWAADVISMSQLITANMGLLEIGGFVNGPVNNGNTGILNSTLSIPEGSYVINTNNSVNECTREDMEMRCRLLYKHSGINFLFVTKNLDYYLPLDSMDKFRDEVAAALSVAYGDKNLIVALWLKMSDSETYKDWPALLLWQNNQWLTNADINFAIYNNNSNYTSSTYYRFKNIFRNIPKPLVICYQVAKVNGLLTTTYFRKGNHIKGHEKIFQHVFKLDKAFDELSVLSGQLNSLNSQAVSSGGGVIGAVPLNSPYSAEIIAVKNKIRLAYLKAELQPELREAEIHFKETYLQKQEVAKEAALFHINQKYGSLFKSNQFPSLIGNVAFPADLAEGTCKTQDKSDAIGDALAVASLLLAPTGLDIVADALAVVYFASTGQTLEMFLASLSFVTPGSLCGAKKLINSSADAVREINAGSRLFAEGNNYKAVQQDVNRITAMFNIKPENVSAPLVNKVNSKSDNLATLFPTTDDKAKLYSNVSDKLNENKRLEFVNKALDDGSFRQKVLNDPDEVLRWAGVVELVRGVKKTDFLSSVPEFATNPQLAEDAWKLFKEENWLKLEELVKKNNINGGWPPNHGFIDIEVKTLGVNTEIDRYGGYYENNLFKDKGMFAAPKGTPFDERALPYQANEKPYKKYRVLKEIPEVKSGKAIPWFSKSGLGAQYELPETIEDLIKEGYLFEIP